MLSAAVKTNISHRETNNCITGTLFNQWNRQKKKNPDNRCTAEAVMHPACFLKKNNNHRTSHIKDWQSPAWVPTVTHQATSLCTQGQVTPKQPRGWQHSWGQWGRRRHQHGSHLFSPPRLAQPAAEANKSLRCRQCHWGWLAPGCASPRTTIPPPLVCQHTHITISGQCGVVIRMWGEDLGDKGGNHHSVVEACWVILGHSHILP